jgi:glutamine amidotransferase
MCELFGASLKKKTDLNAYLREFYSHSRKHPHGWGMAQESEDGMNVLKECLCANDSELLSDILRCLPPQKSLLAHIRFATIGSTKPDNCHPFTGYDSQGRQWTLIHNGTVYSGLELTKYIDLQEGETDSERIFMYLMEKVNEEISQKGNRQLTAEERFGIIERLCHTLSPRNKLNLMVYDGELLYVHKNMDGTLYSKQIENGIIFSTQPLDKERWEDFPLCRAYAFRDGEQVFEGKYHGNEFIPTLDYITAMDAMNI